MAGGERAGAPERARTPLLELIVQQSLDEDYLDAAERRAAGAPRPPRGRPQRTAAVVVAAFGVLVSTAFVQTAQNADAEDEGRASLVRRVESGRERVATQQERVARLASSNASLEARLSRLTDDEQDAEGAAQRLEVSTGLGAVHGPGVTVTVTESPTADANTRIRDSDLAKLANGLWEAGAEAISINGQRLTARTGIRISGLGIEVNQVGVSAPFVVQAIGDRRTLQSRFVQTSSGQVFVGLANRYGFAYDFDGEDDLTLPAGPQRLRDSTSATMVPDPVGPGIGDGADPDRTQDRTDEPDEPSDGAQEGEPDQ